MNGKANVMRRIIVDYQLTECKKKWTVSLQNKHSKSMKKSGNFTVRKGEDGVTILDAGGHGFGSMLNSNNSMRGGSSAWNNNTNSNINGSNFFDLDIQPANQGSSSSSSSSGGRFRNADAGVLADDDDTEEDNTDTNNNEITNSDENSKKNLPHKRALDPHSNLNSCKKVSLYSIGDSLIEAMGAESISFESESNFLQNLMFEKTTVQTLEFFAPFEDSYQKMKKRFKAQWQFLLEECFDLIFDKEADKNDDEISSNNKRSRGTLKRIMKKTNKKASSPSQSPSTSKKRFAGGCYKVLLDEKESVSPIPPNSPDSHDSLPSLGSDVPKFSLADSQTSFDELSEIAPESSNLESWASLGNNSGSNSRGQNNPKSNNKKPLYSQKPKTVAEGTSVVTGMDSENEFGDFMGSLRKKSPKKSKKERVKLKLVRLGSTNLSSGKTVEPNVQNNDSGTVLSSAGKSRRRRRSMRKSAKSKRVGGNRNVIMKKMKSKRTSKKTTTKKIKKLATKKSRAMSVQRSSIRRGKTKKVMKIKSAMKADIKSTKKKSQQVRKVIKKNQKAKKSRTRKPLSMKTAKKILSAMRKRNSAKKRSRVSNHRVNDPIFINPPQSSSNNNQTSGSSAKAVSSKRGNGSLSKTNMKKSKLLKLKKAKSAKDNKKVFPLAAPNALPKLTKATVVVSKRKKRGGEKIRHARK